MSHHVLVVGGGSAGCVLAARLSEDPARRVTLLEAGPVFDVDRTPEALRDPAVIADPAHDWGYDARGGAETDRTPAPRGRGLGGSSAVNAAVAIRARREDVERWATRHGVSGWDWPDVLRAYRSLENQPTGDDALHGRSGPLSVRQRSLEELTPSSRAVVEAAVAEGFRPVDDFDGADPAGAGPVPVNILDEVRQSSATAFLPDAVRARPNLTIVGDVVVDRVLLDGTRAAGVIDVDGRVHEADEVVLAAGTYGSPTILMRSGIGPAEDLTALDIPVVVDLPVGRRLQDQPFFYHVLALTEGQTQMRPATGALVWLRSSRAEHDELDLQISVTHLIAPSASPTGGAIVLAVAVTQPDSRGSVRLASVDPREAPLIDDDYLASDRDRFRLLEGVRLSRRLAARPELSPFLAGELVPGPDVGDEDLEHVVLSNLVTYSHPTSTVPMGGDEDPWAVVDHVGAVRGVDALRVVDASIIPEVPSTVTNLTTMMVAARIAEVAYGVPTI